MGVNVGIRVKVGVNQTAQLPDSSAEHREFSDWLYERFPSERPCFSRVGVFARREQETSNYGIDYFNCYDFDVQMFSHGAALEDAGYTTSQFIGAMTEYILDHYASIHDCPTLEPYWS